MTRAEAVFPALSPDFAADPYRLYEAVRAAGPVAWSRDENAWLVSGRAEAQQALTDEAFESIELYRTIGELAGQAGRSIPDLASVLEAALFTRNPPAHAQRRRFLAAGLASRSLAAYAPLIEPLAARLVGDMRAGPAADVAVDLADRLPPLVMGRALGLAEEEAVLAAHGVAEVLMTLDRGRSMRFYGRVDAAVAEARAMLRQVVAQRRANPGDDALSRMIAVSDESLAFADEEIASNVLYLMASGGDTTSALIGAAIAAVLESGEPRWAVPDAAEAVVEETLRFDAPVQQVSRVARGPLVLGGQPVAAGERLLVLLGAANRDPAAYDRPGRFDPGRSGPPHLGFGAGRHFCIGSGLAKLTAKIAVAALFAHKPRLLPHKPAWWNQLTIRRRATLPVAWGP